MLRPSHCRSKSWRINQLKHTAWLGIVLAAVVALAWTAVVVSPATDHVFGWGSKGMFFDLQGSLAAAEFAHRGGNAYGVNPLDPSGRPHLYSSWWLTVGRFADRHDTTAIGTGLVVLLLFTALACWWPRNAKETVIELALLVSPAWLLAAYRGNNDVVVFAGLAVVIVLFARAGPRAHLAAAALTGALAVLKYFPVGSAIGCLAARSRREALALVAVFTVVLLIGFPSLLPALAVVGHYAPQTFGLHTFGATMLATALPPAWPAIGGLVIGLGAAVIGWRVAAAHGTTPPESGTPDPMLAPAIGGAAVVVCFAIGASFSYKVIFLWWFARWLGRHAPAQLGKNGWLALFALTLTVCWADGITAAILNGFAAGWSVPARARALTAVHLEMIAVQLAWWCLMGACTRVAGDWARSRLREFRASN